MSAETRMKKYMFDFRFLSMNEYIQEIRFFRYMNTRTGRYRLGRLMGSGFDLNWTIENLARDA